MLPMKDQIDSLINPDGTIPPVDWDRMLQAMLEDLYPELFPPMAMPAKVSYLSLVANIPTPSDKP